MARPPRDPSLLSWPWGSAPSRSGGPSSAVGLTSLPIVNSHAESAAMLVWWVELVILHTVLLNDVQKIVVVPQIPYIAVCDATANSPKLQVCSETVNIRSESMEWSMFLLWCRGSFAPFKTKKFCFSQFCRFCCLFVSKKRHFEKNVGHFFLVFC